MSQPTAPARMMLVSLEDAHSDGAYYTVATDRPEEVARLKQRGAQHGFRVVVRRADRFEDAWRFLDQLT